MSAPERIWAVGASWDWNADKDGEWCTQPRWHSTSGPVEYVRADLLAAKDAEIERLGAKLDEVIDLAARLLGTPCEQIRHAQELAAKDAEIERLQTWSEAIRASSAAVLFGMRNGEIATLTDMQADRVRDGLGWPNPRPVKGAKNPWS